MRWARIASSFTSTNALTSKRTSPVVAFTSGGANKSFPPGAAVTEIAVMRGELSGALAG